MMKNTLRRRAIQLVIGIAAALSFVTGGIAIAGHDSASPAPVVVLADGFGWDCIQTPC